MPKLPVDSFKRLQTSRSFDDEADVGLTADRPPEPTSAAQLADDLHRAGIAPDRASCPAFLQQCRRASADGVDALICCAIDSDPLLPVNAAVARESTDDVSGGLQTLASLLQPKRVFLVAEPPVLARCRPSHRAPLPPGMLRKVPLRADYPLTDARLLVRMVLRRKVSPAELPTAARVLVLDAPAAAELGRWSRTGRPDLTLPLGVRDHVAGVATLIRVPRRSTAEEILQAVGIPIGHTLVRSGDFLRDRFVGLDQSMANGELCLHVTAPHVAEPAEPCVRCAWCVEACPARIQPAGLLEAAQRGDLALAERFGLHRCIECGVCSYVCPSRLPLLPSIRQMLGASSAVSRR